MRAEIPSAVVSEQRSAHDEVVAARVLVVPEIIGEPDEVPFPWRIQVDDAVYAVDLVRRLPAARLLDRADRAPSAAMAAVRRALLDIT